MSVATSLDAVPGPRLSPESTLLDLERSERELNVLFAHASRLHREQIQHDSRGCLVCFGAA